VTVVSVHIKITIKMYPQGTIQTNYMLWLVHMTLVAILLSCHTVIILNLPKLWMIAQNSCYSLHSNGLAQC